jgi:hypothetical protein
MSTKIDGAKWSGALNELVGASVVVNYPDGYDRAVTFGELQWSTQLQRWGFGSEDGTIEIDFATEDVARVTGKRGQKRHPEIVVDAARVVRKPRLHFVARQFICGCKIIGNGTLPQPIDIRMCAEHGAAADVLEALQHLRESYTDLCERKGLNWRVYGVVKTADAAIAKATGKVGV